MHLGIDLDDVLVDTFTPLAAFHNRRYGTSLCREDIHSWELRHVWGCTEEEAVRRVQEWLDSPHHDDIVPISGAPEAVVKLAQKHELAVISGRPAGVQEKSEQLVRRHFWQTFSGVHLTDQFGSRRRSKGEVCRELGITHLIEDSPTHARDALAAGITVLLFDSPWNRGLISDDMIRVYTWEEAVQYLAVFR